VFVVHADAGSTPSVLVTSVLTDLIDLLEVISHACSMVTHQLNHIFLFGNKNIVSIWTQ
jgi:hypothetical protein